MNDQEIEQEIQSKGKTAPRVTPQVIEDAIAETHYFTAAQGVRGAAAEDGIEDGSTQPLGLLTFCVFVLRNGFTVTGESACASPENFDAEIGRNVARANAVEKIWPLEGYLLKQRLHDRANPGPGAASSGEFVAGSATSARSTEHLRSDMQQFIGTKIVGLEPMTRAEYNILRGWKLPDNESGEDEGYLVEYRDGGKPNHPDFAGYISWTPKAQADAAYRPTSGLPFGLALEALKKGARVARAGWNGKGIFVYLVPAASYPVQTGAAKAHFGDGSMVPYNAYLALKGVDDTVSTWVPSINDCLADDWHIVQ